MQLRCCRQEDCIQPQPAPRRGLQPANSIMVNPEGIEHRYRRSARAKVHDYDLPARFSIGWHERHSVDGKQTHLYHHRRIYLDGLWIDIRDLETLELDVYGLVNGKRSELLRVTGDGLCRSGSKVAAQPAGATSGGL